MSTDLRFQHRTWVVQRIGWTVIALVLAGAALGLCGPGVLSRTTAGAPDAPLRLGYDRFQRQDTAGQLRFELAPGAARDGEARIWIDRAYLDRVVVESITPEPSSVAAAGERVEWTFAITTPDAPTRITFHLTLEEFGVLSGRAGLGDHAPLELWQLVYP